MHRSSNSPSRPDAARPDAAPLAIAVLVSGSGRSLANLLKVIAAGELAARVVKIISSRPGVGALDIGAAAGIPTEVLRRRDFPSDAAYSEAIFAELEPVRPELILLAGFLRKLVVPPALAGRMLNIHPALLPESGAAGQGFYGHHVHAAVLASGATESGATVHIVDNGYDTGPVVLQRRVPILPDDTPETLGARVFAAE